MCHLVGTFVTINDSYIQNPRLLLINVSFMQVSQRYMCYHITVMMPKIGTYSCCLHKTGSIYRKSIVLNVNLLQE